MSRPNPSRHTSAQPTSSKPASARPTSARHASAAVPAPATAPRRTSERPNSYARCQAAAGNDSVGGWHRQIVEQIKKDRFKTVKKVEALYDRVDTHAIEHGREPQNGGATCRDDLIGHILQRMHDDPDFKELCNKSFEPKQEPSQSNPEGTRKKILSVLRSLTPRRSVSSSIKAELAAAHDTYKEQLSKWSARDDQEMKEFLMLVDRHISQHTQCYPNCKAEITQAFLDRMAREAGFYDIVHRVVGHKTSGWSGFWKKLVRKV